MGYQDSGNCSCTFYIGNCHGNNRGNNKIIQKNDLIVAPINTHETKKRPEEKSSDHEWMRIRLYQKSIIFL